MATNVFDITDDTFDSEVLRSNLPVLVDFWAGWCAPCKAIAPTIAQLAETYNGKMKFCKVNVDENPNSPSTYRVMGIPNLVFFRNGQVVEQKTGNLKLDELTTVIEKVLASA